MKLVKKPLHQYNQIAQALPIKFSWVNKDDDTFTSLYYGAVCKEYITDVMYWHKYKKDGRAYGLKYPTEFREDPYMLIEFPTKESRDNFFSNIHLFEEIGWPTSPALTKGLDVVLELDPEWMKTSWRISLWSLLVKSFAHEANKTAADVGKLPHTESTHWNAMKFHDDNRPDRIIRSIRSIKVDQWVHLKKDYQIYANNEMIHGVLGFFNTFNYASGLVPFYKNQVEVKA